MKCVLHLFSPMASSGVAFQKYLWHLNLAKHIPVSPTHLNIAQVFLILWFNSEYVKGKLPFACRINFLPIFRVLPTAYERAEVSSYQFFTPCLPFFIWLFQGPSCPTSSWQWRAQGEPNSFHTTAENSHFSLFSGLVFTWLSMPSMSSMEKKRIAHKGEIGNCVTASG